MTAILTPTAPKLAEQHNDMPPCFGTTDNGRLMTPDEFDALSRDDVEDGYRYELIHGVFIVSPAAGPMETDPNDQLGYLLRAYDLLHPGVIDKTLYETDVQTKSCWRRADRVIWIGLGRVPKWKHDVPTIIVEFLSAGTRSRKRDYEERRQEYLDLGVQEFWLFDRIQKQLTVFHCRGGVVQAQVITHHRELCHSAVAGV